MSVARLAAALALIVLLAGAPAPAAPPVLRLAWWADAGFPTPFAFSTVGPGGVVRLTLLYDTLVWKDDRGLIPWLADAWRVSPDGTTYVFTLHASVRWQDGEPLTARDVQFSFDYYRRYPFRWADTTLVGPVEARDTRTVVIHLARPFAPFLDNIAGVVPIIPKHIWRGIDHPEREQRVPMAVGSGPYRLAEYHPEAGTYRFLAYGGYFKGRPVIPEIQYVLLPTERQVLAARNGQIDAAMTTTADVVRAFARHAYLRVLEIPALSIARLVFNLDHPPTNQRWFRQAVAYALDRNRIGRIATRGPALVGSAGVVPPADPWYSARTRQYPYDPGRARALLAENGYTIRDGGGWARGPAGTPLQVALVTAPAPDAELVQQMLGQAGIAVTLRTVDTATRAQLASEGQFELLFATHAGTGGDPDYLRTWFTGQDANQLARGSEMRSPEYLSLARLETLALTPERRREAIDRMQVLLSEELPTLPLYYRSFFWIYDSRKIHPLRTHGGLLTGIPLMENKLIFLHR